MCFHLIYDINLYFVIFFLSACIFLLKLYDIIGFVEVRILHQKLKISGTRLSSVAKGWEKYKYLKREENKIKLNVVHGN